MSTPQPPDPTPPSQQPPVAGVPQQPAAGPYYGPPPQYGPPQWDPPQPHSQPYPVQPVKGTNFGIALAANAIWGFPMIVVAITVRQMTPGERLSPPPTAGTLIFSIMIATLITWLLVRRRALRFWQVLLLSMPIALVVSLLL